MFLNPDTLGCRMTVRVLILSNVSFCTVWVKQKQAKYALK